LGEDKGWLQSYPENMSELMPAAHQQSCSSPAAEVSRRRGNDLGTTIKYLR
jgi:hypothetical protein